MLSELNVSVDVEVSGPVSGVYSLLSIGACLVAHPTTNLYLELRPRKREARSRVTCRVRSGLNRLMREGLDPHAAMLELEAWVGSLPRSSTSDKPVFVGLNAPFC